MSTAPLDAVRELLRRDTRPGRGSTAAIDHLMDLLYYGEFGIFEQVASSEQGDFVNLVGVKGPRDAPALWLVSCVASGADPVPGRWASTGGDPLAATLDERAGFLHGLGACGGKADLVLKLIAASRVPADALRRPVAVVALFGEEGRGTGVHALLGAPPEAGAALVGAPTNLTLWADHPGCLVLRLTLRRRTRYRRMPPTRGIFELSVPGRSAHAQVPGLGADALAAGLALLERLREPGDARVLSLEAGEGATRTAGRCRLQVATSYEALPPLPPGVEAQATPDGAPVPFPVDGLLGAWLAARDAGVEAVLDGLGGERHAPGSRPCARVHTGQLVTGRDDIWGTVALWTGPGVDPRAQVERFAGAAQRALAGEDELEIHIHVAQERPAYSGRETAAPLLDTARGALRDARLLPVVGAGRVTSDAGLLTQHGVPTLVFGPGRGAGDLYRDDEAVPVAHLDAALAFYEAFIRRWCCGG